ncbi:2-dehydro-3-deoxyphosphogluconate aldolase [Oscillospiraceae bacterium PP1C4]
MTTDIKDLGFEMAHVGINQPDAQTAGKNAALIADLFGFSERDTEGSIFVNEQFEVLKRNFLGACGHVAIRTTDVPKAKEYLESKGVVFNMDTAGYDENNRLTVIYFQEEIAGFAFHLVQKK